MCLALYRQDVCMNQYEGPVGDTQNKLTMVIPNCCMVNEIRMKP